MTFTEKHRLLMNVSENNKPDTEKDMYKRLKATAMSRAFAYAKNRPIKDVVVKEYFETEVISIFKYKTLIVQVQIIE